MKLIGKGTFTKCYLLDDNKTVYLDSSDPIKECMAYGWFPESELFPSVTLADDGEGYLMQYYPRVSSLKNNLEKSQYELYTKLRELYFRLRAPLNKYDGYSILYSVFSNSSEIDEETREALLEALDACSNMGSDVWFEISPRNVAVDNGKLILLDCFYIISALNKVRGK